MVNENTNLFYQLSHADLDKNWIDVKSVDNKYQIVETKKNNLNRFFSRVLQIISFGKLGHRYNGLQNVSKAILNDPSLKQVNTQEDIQNRVDAMAKLKKFTAHKKVGSDVKSAIEGLRKYDAGLYAEDCFGLVLNRIQELQNNPEKDFTVDDFLKGKDENGNTFFHNMMLFKGNLQYHTIKSFDDLLTKEGTNHYIINCRNAENVTPLDIAIENGHVLIIDRIFPFQSINETRATPFKEEDKDHLIQTLHGWLKTLSKEEARLEYFESFQAPFQYDNLNHIITELHHIACSDPSLLLGAFEKLSQEEIDGLPFEIQQYADLNDYRLEKGFTEIFEPCQQLRTSEEVDKKMKEIGFSATKNIVMEYKDILKKKNLNSNNILFEIIPAALREKDEKDREILLSYLETDVLSQFASYDKDIDFADSRYTVKDGQPILHKLVEDAIVDDDVDFQFSKKFIRLLILKYPDLLFAEDKNERNIYDLINELEDSNKKTEIFNVIDGIEDNLPAVLFKQRTIKSLKYYLEHLGRDLMQKEMEEAAQ